MANKSKYEVQVCILQNGHPIAEASSPISGARILKITSSPNGLLSIPYYPLLEDIEILKIKNAKVSILLDQPWEGYLSSQGRVIYLKEHDRSKRIYRLHERDYANIVMADLRIMIKVVGIKSKEKIALNPKYRASLASLVFDNAAERKGMLIGFLCTLCLFISVIAIIFNLNTKRPETFEELEDLYTLPFINPQNFVTAPEALQSNISRQDLISSVSKYYRNISQMVMGWPIDEQRFLFESSVLAYEKIYQSYHDYINRSTEKQKQINSLTHKDSATRMIYIPSVLGESFQQKLIRLLEKVDLLHRSFETALELRKKTTKIFKKDPKYDWGQYIINNNNSLGLIKVESANELQELAKISVFNQKTNEEMMYFKAESLGDAAEMRRKYLKLKSDKKQPLSTRQIPQIIIPPGVKFASFTMPKALNPNSDRIIGEIRGMDYKSSNKKKIKEPLIGRISSRHVELAIKKNRFQLNLCYELALRRNQNLKGKMYWVWRIDSLGKVSEISLVKSTLRDRQMINCVRRKLASWSFPRPKRGSVKINHRFDFEPQGG